MYQAKSDGKVYHLAADARYGRRQALKRLELDGDLRRAIEREEFEVYYQPEVLLESGSIAGVEALVRWRHPERGLLLPSEFISVAEETGLIEGIGRCVLEASCRQARSWRERYPDGAPPVVWVNLSAKQFEQLNLVEEVAEVLRSTGLYPWALGLEITESVAMTDRLSCARQFQELAELGVQLAIDDFGTGYSSMSHLKRFPVGYVKIDRSFVGGLGKATNDEIVVSGMMSLVRALRMEAIAEGVETAEQATRLREIGCKVAQGYYFSEPLPPQAATELVSSRVQLLTNSG
jgi:EAL domain-containing protein (putative c-di-GMP-specific phosphodiesterase class I)